MEASREKGTDPSVLQQKSVSPRMDTVEISQESRRAASAMSQTETEETDADQYESDSLSDYTDTNWKQMYCHGEITRQEYEKETIESQINCL